MTRPVPTLQPQRLMAQRSGMRLLATGERDYVSGRLPTEIWEISAQEWQSLRAAAGEQA